MKKLLFAIPSLLAAGMVPSQGWADQNNEAQPTPGKSFFDQIGDVVANITESNKYTLAQHRSHGSHESHGSHQSHRSYSGAPSINQDDVAVANLSITRSSTRNEASTPRTTILPSSPAVAKKLKILPGNSKKFRDVVTKVQLALVARGYDVGPVDGTLNATTIAAVYRYQSEAGYVPDGRVTNEVLGSLGLVAQ